MDFFEQQNRARWHTLWLVVAYGIALIGVVAAVDIVVWGALHLIGGTEQAFGLWLTGPDGWMASAIVAAVMLAGSALRWYELARGGGGRVARLMGGRIVAFDTEDSDERELIDVVEEMALASGLTVPSVYLLAGERGINAFAAGSRPANAAIAVTRGALETLERDPLQGLIGHEFSHILNGDMRLNTRLLALLAGITVIGELGATPWRMLLNAPAPSERHIDRDDIGDPRGALFLAGLATLPLVVVGSIGVFAARVIKAAVSRQREYLADAASVQFTRYPDALAGALLRMYEAPRGSLLRAAHAEEISHMTFGRTVGGATRLTATHPTIADRMEALGPKYELWYRQALRERKRRRRERAEPAPDPAPAAAGAPGVAGLEHIAGLTAIAMPDAGPAPMAGLAETVPDPGATVLSAAAIGALAGTVGAGHIDHARALRGRLPGSITQALHTPEGAVHVVQALLLHGPEHANAEREALTDSNYKETMRLNAELVRRGGPDGALDPALRLPILELAIPALVRLAPAARRQLLARVDALIAVDGRVSIFEYAARTLLAHQLTPKRRRTSGIKRLAGAGGDIRVALSLIARATSADADEQAAAYTHALRPILGADPGAPLPLADCGLRRFSDALERLGDLKPMAKRTLLFAAADCVTSDGRVQPAEAELLRVVAGALDVPVPPLTRT